MKKYIQTYEMDSASLNSTADSYWVGVHAILPGYRPTRTCKQACPTKHVVESSNPLTSFFDVQVGILP